MITLPCLIVGGSQILHFGEKNPQVDLIIIREWPSDLKYQHNFKKFRYFPPGSFYSTPQQLGTPYIVSLAGLVPLHHRAFGYFVGPNFFLVGISWVSSFLLWVFRGSQSFSSGYFVGPKFFLVGIRWSKIFSRVENFVNFSCWPPEKKWHRNMSQTTYSIPNRFQQVWILLILERYCAVLVCNCYLFLVISF